MRRLLPVLTRKPVAIAAAGVALAALGLFVRMSGPRLPRHHATVVALVPYGSGPGQLGRTTGWEHKGGNYRMGSLAPAAVTDDGRVLIMDLRPNLCLVSPDGRSVRKAPCPSVPCAYALTAGAGDAVWVGGDLGMGSGTRVVRATAAGTALWAVAAPPLPGARPAPRRRPTGGIVTRTARLVQVEGLFPCDDGGVFVYDAYERMLRLGRDGRVAAEYDVSTPTLLRLLGGDCRRTSPVLCALATRSGRVYGFSYVHADVGKPVLGLILTCWETPGRTTQRPVSLAGLEPIASGDILLRGSDAADNLYFQYRYRKGIGAEEADRWRGPMAIARVGPDGRAVKLFDTYRYYRAAGLGGCGDLIHVSRRGDFYLEAAPPSHYRVDRVSFP